MTAAIETPERRRSLASRFSFRLESLAVLILLAVIMSVLTETLVGVTYLSFNNLMNILVATATIGVLAIGATFVIGSAGLDLSLGSVLGLSGVVGAFLVVRAGLGELPGGLLTIIGILGCLAAGATAGAVNGLLVTTAKIPAFIVTLGMLGIARGVALIISNGQSIYGLPEALRYVGQGWLFRSDDFTGIPMPAIIFVALCFVMHFVLGYTRFGKYTLVIGDNETAARAMGVRVERHRFLLYVLSGAMAGVAGLLFMARVNAGDPTAGLTYELSAITAAIIGGTNLFGGRASILGTLIGALIMGGLQNGLNLLAVQSFYQQVAIGVVLIFAVWLDRLNARRMDK